MSGALTLGCVAALALLSGCAAQNGSAFTQSDADALSERCGAPEGWIEVREDGEVRFEPPMDADYEVSVCLLNGIKDAGVTKFGFVGNEKYPEPEGQ